MECWTAAARDTFLAADVLRLYAVAGLAFVAGAGAWEWLRRWIARG